MIKVDELQIVELLQHKMAGIEQHVAAGMVFHPLQEHFERDAIVQVFSGMDLETQIHSCFVKRIQNGQPAGGQFREGGLDRVPRAVAATGKRRARPAPRKKWHAP